MDLPPRPPWAAALFALAVAYALGGAFLLAHALSRSWHTWTPPGSAVLRTDFAPYWATLVPGLALIVVALGTAAAAALVARQGSPGEPAPAVRGLGWGHLLAAAVLALHASNYSFFMVCANPGGCSRLVIPFWPALLPALAWAGVGAGLLLAWRRAGTPTGRPPGDPPAPARDPGS